MLTSRDTSRIDLAALADRTQNFDSFGRGLLGSMLRAASKEAIAAPGDGDREIRVPVEATVRMTTVPGGGWHVIGCICVTGEGCPCIDLGDLLGGTRPPPTYPDQTVPLSARDHTAILEWVIRNALPIIKALGIREPRKGRTLSRTEVLDALEKVAQRDPHVHGLVRSVASNARAMEAFKLPKKSEAAVAEVLNRIERIDSFDELSAALEDLANQPSTREVPGLREGLLIGQEILHDGLDTVYGGESGVTTVAKSSAGADVAKSDVSGAVGGAIVGAGVGTAVPGVGTGAGALTGAVTGAVGNSAVKVVEQIWDWIFD